jgi:prepilin peptidase CpaA
MSPLAHPSDRLLSTTAAVLAGGALFSTGAFGSWTGAGAVGLLMATVEEDVRGRRIPNRLTGFGLAAALLHAGWTAGLGGLLPALAGATLGLAVLAFPFALRVVGAGDAKAAMALGAFFGPDALIGLLCWATEIGALMALATLAVEGGLGDLLRRWRWSLLLSGASGRFHYIGPAAGSTARAGLPFGVALAFGAAAQQTWGSSWIF